MYIYETNFNHLNQTWLSVSESFLCNTRLCHQQINEYITDYQLKKKVCLNVDLKQNPGGLLCQYDNMDDNDAVSKVSKEGGGVEIGKGEDKSIILE